MMITIHLQSVPGAIPSCPCTPRCALGHRKFYLKHPGNHPLGSSSRCENNLEETCDMSLCFCHVSALFHNNCMYLAHHLVTLGHEYSSRFPAVLKSHTSTFIDQVTMLRELGTSMFLKFMRGQRKQILDILRDSGKIYVIN